MIRKTMDPKMFRVVQCWEADLEDEMNKLYAEGYDLWKQRAIKDESGALRYTLQGTLNLDRWRDPSQKALPFAAEDRP